MGLSTVLHYSQASIDTGECHVTITPTTMWVRSMNNVVRERVRGQLP